VATEKTTQAANDTLTFWLVPGNTAPVRPSALWVALFTADPTAAGSVGAEVASGLGYARQPVTMATPANGQTQSTNPLTFGPASGNWGTITHAALCRSGNAGTADLLYVGALDAPAVVDSADSLTIAAAALMATES